MHPPSLQDLSDISSKVVKLCVDFVVVCTGLHTVPQLPKLEVRQGL